MNHLGLLLISLIVCHSALSQRLVFKENYKSIVDVDAGKWSFGETFKLGDTVLYVRDSKTDKDYIVVQSDDQVYFVYRTIVKDIDGFLERKRILAEERMLSEKKFVLGTAVDNLKKGDTVTIVDAQQSGDYILVLLKKGEAQGSALLHYLNLNPALEEQVRILVGKNSEEQNAIRARRLKAKYGTAIYERIMKGQIWIGMTTEMAEESVGRPMKINRSGSATRISEQWVYNDKYLYFDNGKLSSWQDTVK